MKILCVIDSLGSGGAQRQIVNLSIKFKQAGHDVTFLVYHRETFYYPMAADHEIPVHEILESRYLTRLLKMRRFIRLGKFDAVLSFLEAANFICEISSFPNRKWRLVVGERNANPEILRSKKLKLYRLFHFFADAVVANSHENIRLVRKVNPWLNERKFHVIYNTVDLEKWSPCPEKYIYRQHDFFHLIVPASHIYRKNLNGLIEAVNLLDPSEKTKLKIDWYGSHGHDKSKDEAQNKINEYNLNSIFSFHNATNDIHEKVNQADALGLFSFFEGLPNVVCEAMAMGKPVIASNVSDTSLLLNDPNLLFDPENPSTIATVIRHLLKLDTSIILEVSEKNRQAAINIFNNEKIVNRYLKLLSGLEI